MQALPEMQPEEAHAGATQPPRRTDLLVRRAVLVLALLLIYRLGMFIPVPGVDWAAVNRVAIRVDQIPNAAASFSVMALGLQAYITASVVIQLLIWLVPALERSTATSAGRQQIGLYVRLLTIPLAAVHAEIVARTMRSFMRDATFINELVIVVTMTAGVIFLVWLSDQITKLEMGDGVLLILAADVVASIPRSANAVYEYVQMRNLSPGMVFLLVALLFAILAGMVFVELARRRIYFRYSHGSAERPGAGGNSYLSLKINSAGILPLIFASLLFSPLWASIGVYARAPEWLRPGQPLYEAVTTIGIVFFTFCLAPAIWPPRAVAGRLQRSGAVIPSVPPGQATADYIAYVSTRLTVLAAVYLAAVNLLPWSLPLIFRDLPLIFGGFSLLVVVIPAVGIWRPFRGAEEAVPR